MTTPRVTLLPDGKSYRHQSDTWADEYPLSRLAEWIRFYRKLAEKRSEFYRADYTALRMFERGLKQ